MNARRVIPALSLLATAGLSAQVTSAPSPELHPAASLACEAEPVCGHFYADGQLFKTLTGTHLIVSVGLRDTGKYMRADIAVTNTGDAPIDVLPQTFILKSTERDVKELKYLPPQKLIASAQSHAAWGNALQAMAAGMATNQSTTQSTTNGNVNVYGSNGGYANGTYSSTTTSTTTSPDYAAQARASQQIAARRGALAAASDDLMANSLLATTLAPGQMKIGRVYFERTRHHEQTLLTMSIGGTEFIFPFHFAKK